MSPTEEFPDSPETVSAYDEVPLWSAPFGQLLFREVPMKPCLQVLDLGCGTGFPAIELAERLGRMSRVIALDPWPNALDRARAKTAVYKIPNLRFVQGDGEAMPFADQEFDLIVCNLGLNNWEHPAKVLKDCARVVKIGGTFCLTTNPQGHWREFYEAVRRVLERRKDIEAILRLNKQEAHRLSFEEAEPLFKEAGFTSVRRLSETLVFRYLDTASFLDHHFVGWGFKAGWTEALSENLWKTILPEMLQELDGLPRDRGAIRLTVPVEYWEFEKRA
jgi:ubiquinone/menaquinone biosynthesis C-methylase UbiE